MPKYRVFFAFWLLEGLGRASMLVEAGSEDEAKTIVEEEVRASITFRDTSPIAYEARLATINDLDEFGGDMEIEHGPE